MIPLPRYISMKGHRTKYCFSAVTMRPNQVKHYKLHMPVQKGGGLGARMKRAMKNGRIPKSFLPIVYYVLHAGGSSLVASLLAYGHVLAKRVS